MADNPNILLTVKQLTESIPGLTGITVHVNRIPQEIKDADLNKHKPSR